MSREITDEFIIRTAKGMIAQHKDDHASRDYYLKQLEAGKFRSIDYYRPGHTTYKTWVGRQPSGLIMIGDATRAHVDELLHPLGVKSGDIVNMAEGRQARIVYL